MATSGTVGNVTIEVATILDHAFAMCGKISSTVSGELLRRARERLQFALWSMSNEGINLWCLKKTVFNVSRYRSVIPMTVGTVDVLNALFRELVPMVGATPFSAPGIQGQALAQPLVVRNVSGEFPAGGTVQLYVEASVDNINWEQVAALNSATVSAGSSFAIDLDNSMLAQYWRVRDGTGTLLTINNLRFRAILSEIPTSKLNRDDYQQLPQKYYEGQQSLQFWFDKQVNPQLWMWPQVQDDDHQLIVWEQSLIQDVGSLTNTLAVPYRWYDAVISLAAYRIAMIIPPAELPEGKLQELQGISANDKRIAAGGESDGSSWRLTPKIRAYTR